MKKVVAIVGPTGVGKTRLSIEVAKRFGGEIISGDSMQIYKGMDIGTAKVTREEKQDIPHYMVDIRYPEQPYSAAEFQAAVTEKIDEILERGKLPVLVGGTGLYLQAVLYGYQFPEIKRNKEIQERLEAELHEYGSEYMWNKLNNFDPAAAEKIHPNNHRRLIRALEVAETTEKASFLRQEKQIGSSPYEPIIIGLEMEREILYQRINNRVDEMMEEGLLEEVEHLYKKGLENTQALQAIGYKEFIPYFKKQATLSDSVDVLKRNSRRYAKRQYTWFRNKMDVRWYSITPENAEEKVTIILKDLAGMLEEK